MTIIVATQMPHWESQIAPRFETAPYYLVLDLARKRTVVFPHPVQFQVSCSPEVLIQRLGQYAPQVILAGAFSVRTCDAAGALGITLQDAQGRASIALENCTTCATSQTGWQFH